jgi:hypothetical protein
MWRLVSRGGPHDTPRKARKTGATKRWSEQALVEWLFGVIDTSQPHMSCSERSRSLPRIVGGSAGMLSATGTESVGCSVPPWSATQDAVIVEFPRGSLE